MAAGTSWTGNEALTALPQWTAGPQPTVLGTPTGTLASTECCLSSGSCRREWRAHGVNPGTNTGASTARRPGRQREAAGQEGRAADAGSVCAGGARPGTGRLRGRARSAGEGHNRSRSPEAETSSLSRQRRLGLPAPRHPHPDATARRSPLPSSFFCPSSSTALGHNRFAKPHPSASRRGGGSSSR